MVEMNGIYQGDKHCELEHEPSKAKISTDAPKDNQGRGEAFSPTDLVGAALGSCIVTTAAIVAERDGIDLRGARFQIKKEMQASPRQIKALHLVIEMPATVPEEYREKLKTIAHTCPVSRSLHPSVALPIEWVWH